MQAGFGIINIAVIILYLLLVLGIGIYFSKRSTQSTDSFFKAGGRIPGWAAGISIFATSISAITFMAAPAKTFRSNWAFLGNGFAVFTVTPLVIFFFVPFFRKLKATTAYEYLEARYDLKVRGLSSLVFMLFHIGRIAIILYLPTLAITSVTNINPYILVCAIGIICIISTYLGGFEGVIWCDVMQGVLLLGGAAFIVLFAIFKIDGGIGEFFNIAVSHDKFFPSNSIGFSFTKETVMSTLFCSTFVNLYSFLASQDIVQRYNSTKNTKETNKSLMMNLYLTLLVPVLFYGMGTALYAFYYKYSELLPKSLNIDSIVPYFIAHEMPVGVSGLMVAAIFAAAQSSISSSLNSISACYITDFKKRLSKREISEKESVNSARKIIIICGVLGMLFAIYMVQTNKAQLLNFFNTMLGMFGGPIAGIFLLGIFTKRANGDGAFYGIIISVIVEYIAGKTDLYFMYYGVIGVVVSFVSGYLMSLLFTNRKSSFGLTVYTINKKIKSI